MNHSSMRVATRIRVLAPRASLSATSNIGGKPEAYRVRGARLMLLLSNGTVLRMSTPLP